MKIDTPFDLMQAGFRLTQLGIEAQAVIWMRGMGATGVWNTPFDEGWRAFREKPDAFVEAMGRATEAAIGGKGAHGVITAAVDPLARHAGQNRKRLEERGARRGLA